MAHTVTCSAGRPWLNSFISHLPTPIGASWNHLPKTLTFKPLSRDPLLGELIFWDFVILLE